MDGLHILSRGLDIQQSDNGYPIHITKREGPLYVKKGKDYGEIKFQQEIHFFRALGLWLENCNKENDFELTEEAQFTMNGAMLDASRNAVLNVDGIHNLLQKMAVMGLNVLMVYTEDTYEVDEYPYFGYMRGRYIERELKSCDKYAQALGIEMIPCIQTLAHLTEALKWNYASGIKDTSDILLVDEPETYQFLERLIEAVSKPFRSNRIHIGMDEAHQLGLGKYLEKNGYEERFNIMNKHLKQVILITEKKGLKPMIWSDMYFRLGSKHGGYYDPDAEIPKEVINSIPSVQLVYWDYYHTDEEFYRTFIQKHKQLNPNPVFAGGAWTWNGIAPNYGKAIATTKAALTACKKEGIKEMFMTMWGDNGAETPLLTALPILQLYAEHSYHETVDEEHLAKRFQFCTGGNLTDFMKLNRFDETPGVAENNLHESNPSKFLLWQDILIGLYDENIRGLALNQHYKQLTDDLQEVKQRNAERQPLFSFYEQLAKVLSVKAEMGINIKAAYDIGDKDKMKDLFKQIECLKDDIDLLRKEHRSLWFTNNKPFGWEVVEIRYGGAITRIETVLYRINQWLEGKTSNLEELDADRLYFEGPYNMPEGAIGRNLYHRIVTAGNLS